jgi:DNA-binding NtrC family response regulator
MNKNGKILVVDDDEGILLSARVVLKKNFSSIETIGDPALIPDVLSKEQFDVILLDMNFAGGATSGKEGLDWLKKIRKINPDSHVIMITAYGDIDLAVKAMKEGAVDFVVKPWDNNRLLATVMAAYRLSITRKEIEQLRSHRKALTDDISQPYSHIIGSSQALEEVMNAVDKVSTTDANVLLLGENGTGKELVARLIHRKSLRADSIFIGIDLGAVPETLFESELFGHVKGAFTDAKEDRAGRFELASGGTLFLDEIGNLSPSLQSKLLAAIQNRETTRVGSNKTIQTDVRLITATNMPLHEMVDRGDFRQDLLYRINTVEIRIPPLRDRVKDIPDLVQHFLRIYAKKYNKVMPRIAKTSIKKLGQYHWPGNIRELQHLVERAMIMSEKKEINLEDYISDIGKSHPVQDTLNLEEVEKNTISNALRKYSGNVTKAASELGLGRTTIYRKMEKYGL